MTPLTAILLTIAFSAFFSGMEIAFVSANKFRFEIERNTKNANNRFLSVFFAHPQQFISTMLVGNNIALVIYGLQTAVLMQPWIMKFTHSSMLTLLIQTILSTLIILITAEYLPKTLFRLNANFWLRFFAFPLLVCYLLLFPIAYVTSHFSRRVIRLWGNDEFVETNEMDFGRADISNLIVENAESQEHDENNTSINEYDAKLFQNALDFSKVKLRECIVPRTEIVAVEKSESLITLKQKFIESGYSKVLIYDDNIDNIIGYIHSFDFFQNPKNLNPCIRDISIVPESMSANKLMETFIQQKKSIAVVVDEFGGTAGIVTLEDIMEEIFGEIEDEHDHTEYISKKISDNEYLFSARLEIDAVNEEFDLNIPESDEYETIAGFILNHSGSFPKVNDEIKINQFCFRIINALPTKIVLVKLSIEAPTENN